MMWKSKSGALSLFKNRPNNVIVVQHKILDLAKFRDQMREYTSRYPTKNKASLMMSLSLEEADDLAYFLLEELGHVEYRVRAPGEERSKDNAPLFCRRKNAVWNFDMLANQYPERAFVVERKHYSTSKWERVL